MGFVVDTSDPDFGIEIRRESVVLTDGSNTFLEEPRERHIFVYKGTENTERPELKGGDSIELTKVWLGKLLAFFDEVDAREKSLGLTDARCPNCLHRETHVLQAGSERNGRCARIIDEDDDGNPIRCPCRSKSATRIGMRSDFEIAKSERAEREAELVRLKKLVKEAKGEIEMALEALEVVD